MKQSYKAPNQLTTVWPFPPFPNPLDKGTKVPKFNPDNYEDAPL
jgi:hypothetical protein